MNKKLLQTYGLAFNPFSTELPLEALRCTPPIDSFCWKVVHTLLREGGFAMVIGEAGYGKSSTMRILEDRLLHEPEVRVGAITRPQGGVSDFYRELGEIFGVPMRPHNRWCGFKALREAWQRHIESTLYRPVLLVDEAQEMNPVVLSEMRLLTSTHFDSRQILSVVLAGDSRLSEKLQRDELLPLASRIRTRLTFEYAEPEELRESLKHLLAAAGNPALMTPQLIATLADHAAGNYRLLTTMGGELLASAAQRELPQLDEKLYFDVFTPPKGKRTPAVARRKRA